MLRVDGSGFLQSTWARRAFNASWGHHLEGWISVGASADVEQTEQSLVFSADGTFEELASNRSRTTRFTTSRSAMAFALRGEVGGIARVSDQLSIGASARTPSWTFASSLSSNFTVNAGVGVRYRLSSTWSLLGGFQTDFSLLDSFTEDEVDGRIAATRRDIFHSSFGAAISGGIGSFVLGLRFSYSDGESLAIDTLAPSPEVTTVDDREYSGLLVLYGSIDFGAVARELTPSFIGK